MLLDCRGLGGYGWEVDCQFLDLVFDDGVCEEKLRDTERDVHVERGRERLDCPCLPYVFVAGG
jgi:hypothetical protein